MEDLNDLVLFASVVTHGSFPAPPGRWGFRNRA